MASPRDRRPQKEQKADRKLRETALLAASTGAWYRLIDKQGQPLLARLKGTMRLNRAAATNPVAVGDRVVIERNADGTASIVGFEERTNEMVRQSTHRKNDHQVLAANLDQAAVVQSFRSPHYKHGFIDRFLVTCEAYHIPAFIIMNKNDLEPEATAEREQFVHTYRAAGYDVFFTGEGQPLDSLMSRLAGRTTLLIGQSGVGKSTLINRLDPALTRKTAEVSAFNEKGRHTTTFAEMMPLPAGGYIIDTPGLRELGLAGFEPHEIGYYFPEIEPLKRQCPHRQCLCDGEPDCPVLKAAEEGALAATRLDSFIQMMDSLSGESS